MDFKRVGKTATKKGTEIMSKSKKKGKKAILTLFSGAAAGVVNGFLGAGGGIILLWALGKLNPQKGDEGVRNNFAITVATVLLLCTVSAVSYSHHSPEQEMGIAELCTFIIPGMAGGIFGAYLTDKLNTRILKATFCALMIIAGVNMAF
ncbi:MAG: sulfite exporter TauE/SafE family protein [Ruminococcaceae bacterium]|nr:sulfite exporter TauE/SafE family protein [Oscillospiraceae bacterium]